RDVDVVFVAEPVEGGDERAALAAATDLARRTVHACSAATAEGALWAVDTALRPEGKNGPLVRTLASHVSYYERWAKTWEFQALLKARPVAGDPELGRAYVDAVAPLIWSAAGRENFVEDVQGMRRRVEAHIKPGEADRQLKLGPGGLRDVEFAVQLLQLVHGRSDVFLRSPTTLTALEQLSTRGYVGRADAGELDRAYRFLRTLEHRIQLHRLRRTHVVPEAEADLRRLGRSLGMRSDPVKELTETWRRHAREVRRLHEKLFYRPLLAAVARLPGDEARLTPEAAKERLVALGYVDPAGALRHIEALTRGLSRRAAIQRTLLPVMLGWFADGPDPDAGLLGFRQVSEALGSTHWYLRFLRDEGVAAERLATVLASSRYAADLLLRAPEAVGMLGDTDDLVPRSREVVEPETLRSALRYDDAVAAIGAARAVRRRELFRTAVADLLGLATVEQVGEGLTAVAAATLEAGLATAVRTVQAERRAALPTRLAVIAMGRLGGHEMSYASDADVVFVHEPLDGVAEDEAARAALDVVNELRRMLAVPMADPPLPVDADLRPEGRSGPLVRTLASYEAYYARWGEVWERQALLRAEPLCGDRDLAARFMAVVEPLRWPEGGLTEQQVREVRRIKARVESERLPRGADPSRHTKLGPGGLSDVEWTAQLLQLLHAAQVPALRTTGTLTALDAAVEADLLAAADRDALASSWRTVSRVRNAVLLVRARSSDELPRDTRELAKVARVLGYEPGETAAFLDHYRRVTRRARAVVDRVLFGL
ncbi:MAG TPA: bifunctional [glutamine synthetase] adenylyltransferase/[glutamine synthetase]-adenylyl-L-tyrosine phosphorylase, partial [Jiangellales bacterium]|nr:bifunctional [glutamine synthetase] adenylyltransferase/[glutamine synthetase]-adenylyl-L-tyrosine phosphorylase [Jiangellales bacterium]